MKLTILIFRDIFKFMCGRKAIFFIIMIGMIFNTIGICFYYGYFKNIYEDNVLYENRTCSYAFSNDVNMNEAGKSSFYDFMASNKNLPPVKYMDITEEKQAENAGAYKEEEYSRTIPVGRYSTSSEEVMSGRCFSAQEATSGANVVIASTDALCRQSSALTNGDSLLINNLPYTIVGQVIQSDVMYGCYIPITAYIKNNIEFKYAHVVFSAALSHSQNEYLLSSLRKIYPNIDIVLPPSQDTKAVGIFWTYFLQILVIFLLAVANILSLFFFWTKSNERKHKIYIMCGCYKLKVFVMILSEILCLTFLSSAAGMAIIQTAKNVLVSLDIFSGLSLPDFAGILALNILASAAMSLYIGIRLIRSIDTGKASEGGDNY